MSDLLNIALILLFDTVSKGGSPISFCDDSQLELGLFPGSTQTSTSP